MKSTLQVFLSWCARFARTWWGMALIAVVVILGGWYGYSAVTAESPYQFVSVTKGSIGETVSVTGNTTPIKSVTLGFQSSGTIARVYRQIGDRVSAGDVIAELNTATLSAALQQAQAAYNSAVASRSSTSLTEAATSARNTYLSAYTTLDTLLYGDVDVFFGSPTAYGLQFLVNAPMYSYGELSKDRDAIVEEMARYQESLAAVSKTDPSVLLANANAVADNVASFINKIAIAVNDQNSQVTSAQVSALSSARTTVNALLATLSTARDTYRTASVGATTLADASVEQAAAGVAVAKANLQGTAIVAPISGVITQQDAKVGQIAAAGTVLVSIISAGAYEVDASIPETDIGKISIGNTAVMTLDAFPTETFEGTVFYIDPAQTITQGVVDYKIKIAFTMPDPRLKSGLTANVDILTRKKDDVLILPQYAILQNDEGTFVEVLEEGEVVRQPVTLGIQDDEGKVEVLTGVSEGQQVLNIGLKQ